MQAIEDFTCLLYGAKKPMALNKYRHRVFEIAYAPKDPAKPFAKMKGVDASSLPPCEAEVRQQIERTAFVAKYWHDAHLNSVTKIPSKGWELIDGTYRFVWFEGDQLPDDVIPEKQKEDDENSDGDDENEQIDESALLEDDDDLDDIDDSDDTA